MKRSALAVLFLLGALGPLAAAPPDVPETLKASPGELTRFVVKGEKGKKVAFAPSFKEDACFVDRLYSDDPDVIRFLVQPRRSGEFVITFWTVGEGAYKQVTITVGTPPNPPGPPQPPPPTPKPDGALGVRKASRDGLASVQPFPDRLSEAKALAGAARSTASAVAAGAAVDSAGKFAPDIALSTWRTNNRSAVRSAVPWEPWAVRTSGRLEAAFKDGKLPTQGDWVAAFNEVADGLED